MKDQYRYDLSALLNQRITFRDQASGKIQQVPISAVANVSFSSTYGAVMRKDRNRMITIWSNVISGYNANEINSVVKPVIILLSVMFSTISVFGELGTFSMDFAVIMTGVGIVSLAEVVVNNAIVLIDYITILKRNRKLEMGLTHEYDLPPKESIECLIEAVKTRLRRILLTAITTILGLIPLVIGLNIDFIGLFSGLILISILEATMPCFGGRFRGRSSSASPLQPSLHC